MSNQKSLCCYAGIKLTGKDRPECEKCGRIIGTDLPVAGEQKTVKEKWQTKFLNAGTEKGLGDLSMMIGVVSEILQAERQKREEMVEAERERIAKEIDKLATEYEEKVDCEWSHFYGDILRITQPNNPQPRQ